MKKYSIIVLFCLFLASNILVAVPARPGKFLWTQPDGSVIELQRHGDEFSHWTTGPDGQLMEESEDGWYRPAGTTSPSSMRKSRLLSSGRRSAVHPSSSMTIGERHIPVFLVEFTDVHFTIDDPATQFDELLNKEGYDYNGGTGSVRDYYKAVSHGQFTPVFDVLGPVEVKSTMATYGGNDSSGSDKAPELCLYEAALKLDADIDFSQYDHDGDGVVDMILFYYAGFNEAEGGSTNSIWPHQWTLLASSNSAVASNSFDGVKLGTYFCTSELVGYSGSTMCGIGTTCHEFAHSLGLPDFYDTDYGDSGTNYGTKHGCGADTYSYDLMCMGSYNNDGRTPPFLSVLEQIMLDWLPESALVELSGSGVVEIPDVTNGVAYYTPTSVDGEIFIYECRSLSGWDAYLPGGEGLIIYHLDRSVSHSVSIYDYYGNAYNETAYNLWYNWGSTNQINENATHPCYYIVPAMDQTRIAQECGTGSYSGYPLSYDETRIPFPGTGEVSGFVPVDWEGVESALTFSDISYSSGKVTMTAKLPREEVDYNFIANPGNGVYQAGDRFALTLSASDIKVPVAVAWFFDGEPVSVQDVLLSAGRHTVEARITLEDGSSETVLLEIEAL